MYFSFFFEGANRKLDLAHDEVLALRLWEDEHMMPGRFTASMFDFSPTQDDWAARPISAANVARAKATMVETLKVPSYMIMVARMSLACDADGKFTLAQAIAHEDLRPASGAHTSLAGRKLLIELLADQLQAPLLTHNLQNVDFRVLLVDDLVICLCALLMWLLLFISNLICVCVSVSDVIFLCQPCFRFYSYVTFFSSARP
jgi:hypothetical protein